MYPDEHYRFCPVPGARNCVSLHLFIDIIHDCCSHIIPLVHLKQINTPPQKNTQKILIYNCNTALKKRSEPGLLRISSGTIRETPIGDIY